MTSTLRLAHFDSGRDRLDPERRLTPYGAQGQPHPAPRFPHAVGGPVRKRAGQPGQLARHSARRRYHPARDDIRSRRSHLRRARPLSCSSGFRLGHRRSAATAQRVDLCRRRKSAHVRLRTGRIGVRRPHDRTALRGRSRRRRPHCLLRSRLPVLSAVSDRKTQPRRGERQVAGLRLGRPGGRPECLRRTRRAPRGGERHLGGRRELRVVCGLPSWESRRASHNLHRVTSAPPSDTRSERGCRSSSTTRSSGRSLERRRRPTSSVESRSPSRWSSWSGSSTSPRE
jgi:hypothetical protein